MNYNVGLLNGPPSCPQPLVFSSNKCFSRKYIIYRNFTGGEYTFSEIFSYESTMFSNFLWSGRSLCSLARGKRINENDGMLASEGNIDCYKEDFSTKDANSIKLSESSPLLELLMDALNNSSVTDVLEKWIENGNILDRDEASVAILSLDNRRLYGKALQVSENSGFGRSLFERLSSLGHQKHLLNVQYRMHPSISKFSNVNFYDKRISDGSNVLHRSYEKQYLTGKMYGPYSFISIEA